MCFLLKHIRVQNRKQNELKKNFSTMVEPYETILEVLYVDQMLSGYLFQDYSNDSYEDMFYVY